MPSNDNRIDKCLKRNIGRKSVLGKEMLLVGTHGQIE